MLSGFVISHAYDRKLISKTMSFGSFFVTRLIRLYPLYFLAAIISALVFSPKKAFLQGDMHVVHDYLISLTLTLFYLPSRIEGNSALFPINGVCWSLFFELVINIFYALLRPMLSTKNLIISIIISGSYLLAKSLSLNSIDGGYEWNFDSIIIGLIRTTYGFLFGLLLHRIFMKQAITGVSTNKCIAIIFAASIPLAFSSVGDFDGTIDCVGLFIIFPLCILMGARINPDRNLMVIFNILGIISYPIYLLHDSFGAGVFRLFGALGVDIKEFAPYSGFLLVVILSIFCLMINHVYDLPIRRYLSYIAFDRKRI